jgi:hypothetical protein
MRCEGYDVSGEDANGQGAAGSEPAEDRGADGGRGASGDEAAWQDLVARYDLPADPPGPAPWPDRESLIPPARDQGAAGHAPAQHRPASPGPGTGDRARVIRPATPPPVPARASRPASDSGDTSNGGPGDEAGDDTEEHYIPPPPPPFPNLDPIAKGAWTAVFGGPAYLLVTTLIGWTVPGWAALLAVMAFVGGFAVIVMRLGDGPSRGAGPDGGAVL